jgi:hypothetical protein
MTGQQQAARTALWRIQQQAQQAAARRMGSEATS